ncbi:amino acid ABC transporter permease [Rhodovulum euryhalinum]|uniref:L-glutamine ABC transporter membrane protein /L-glutamate ABC transporter membrane protein /L-aspartate ABC transporter membrane protein /L-asparagine ABC transporter membrane protein n=1 Tax=Rhodovulum euryhalinum TaxID=35805 RepID=A0A4R2KLE5_9RHOB|nr:ABC transporter permease subunit [Rhodovulum euryhalinum]TCO71529.1 L-glutamine ABC transporter membrane protein /L-glutamate ABC transporter membrane protein /L-aspartate ABC transporter membrane protein /L-asparagine ABC transporter membrane protein [Rhodovulum euryhalinum]
MTTLTDPPKDSFRLGMLIYDTRYRALTIQVVALFAFMLLAAWLINNTVQNLASLGKPIDFGFLSTAAQYDINQTLIAYDNQDSHLRASAVGLLNTLLVAVMGCALATVVGVLVGILRLSRNWLVARIMTVYVELFRNVPVLLWIVFAMAILIESLPAPRDFRGEDAPAAMLFGDSVALTNRGFYVPEPLFARTLGDLPVFGAFDISLDFLAILAVLGAGLFASGLIRTRADRIQNATGIRPTTWYLRLGVVLLPLIALLVALGFHLGYPELRGFNFQGGIHMRNSLIALWLALSFYTAAFIAEAVRGGILAISKGQTEAAAALGLRPGRIMSLVILPQAMRVIIPPLISQYLNLTKNSSLAIAVGYMDITGTLGGITMNQTGRELECVLLLMLIYLVISLLISAVMNWYNTRVKLVER